MRAEWVCHRAASGPGQTLTGLPNHLPTLTTQELEQIMELQRALTMERNPGEPPSQLPLHFLSSMGREVSPTAPYPLVGLQMYILKEDMLHSWVYSMPAFLHVIKNA